MLQHLLQVLRPPKLATPTSSAIAAATITTDQITTEPCTSPTNASPNACWILISESPMAAGSSTTDTTSRAAMRYGRLERLHLWKLVRVQQGMLQDLLQMQMLESIQYGK